MPLRTLARQAALSAVLLFTVTNMTALQAQELLKPPPIPVAPPKIVAELPGTATVNAPPPAALPNSSPGRSAILTNRQDPETPGNPAQELPGNPGGEIAPGGTPGEGPGVSSEAGEEAPSTSGGPAPGPWGKIPNVKPQPPAYNFPPPVRPGYYSLLDVLQNNYRQGPPKYGYTRSASQSQSFFDADFRYLDDPKNTDIVPTDILKRIKIGDDWMFSTGGQAWSRYMNILNQQLGPKRNVEDMDRVRVYGDLWYKDEFRVYIEYIAADSIWQSVAPAATDIEKSSFLNAFVDLKIFEWDGIPAYARVGRQELALGSQRLVSNIDFLNSRRTFDGVRGTYRGQDWDGDLFFVRPVITSVDGISSSDDKTYFGGAFATYHPNKTDLLDLYYFYSDVNESVTQLGLVRSPTTLHTFGARYTGNKDGFLWDFENAIQTGSMTNETVLAGMSTTGVGYNWKDSPWKPTLWAYLDYASGDHSPNSGGYNTFNQLFAFGHNYLGAMDVVGRQNVIDPNLHLAFYPTEWVSVWIQAHQIWLASKYDALYNLAGTAIRRDATGASGTDVGQELNFIFNFHLSANQDIQVGYGHLFGGRFLRNTGPTSQIDYTYVTYNIKW